jgi:hypothetical protein
MSDLIRAIRMTPPPRRSSSDAPIIRYPDTHGLLDSQMESQQRATERQMARVIRAGRQQAPADSVRPIRIPTQNNFFINLPVN